MIATRFSLPIVLYICFDPCQLIDRFKSLSFPAIPDDDSFVSEKKIVEMKLEIESKERMRGKFKFFKYRFAITRGIIHRATYIATHTRRNAYPRISTTSARCLS